MPETSESITLKEVLAEHTTEADPALVEQLPDQKLRCYACGHRCLILEGRLGICKVRFNQGGRLLAPTGYIGALQLDPVEKKPFFHALPGSDALSFGMLGCDYHCAYCQNWITSQAIRDPNAVSPIIPTTAEQLVGLAHRYGARIIASTYNEPLITSEWAVEVFKVAKRERITTAYISNGNGTPQVLDFIRPWVDLYKVDLKGFDDKDYRQLGGQLQVVLDTIRMLVERKFWVEIVTLIIPDFNDSDEELKKIAEFLVSVSPDTPWHVTAFHKDYKMQGPANTTAETLIRAAQIGQAAGLKFVYAGNLPGRVGPYENTYCPGCRTLLIQRHGYTILKNNLLAGCCPACRTAIPGVWE